MPECARTQASAGLEGRSTGPAGPLMVGVHPGPEGLRGLLGNENLRFPPAFLAVSGIGYLGYLGYRGPGREGRMGWETK